MRARVRHERRGHLTGLRRWCGGGVRRHSVGGARCAALLCLLAALVLVPVGARAQSADEGGLLVRWIERNLSDAGREVRLTGFRGVLSAQASLETLTIADDEGIWLTLEGVALDWNRAAVLAGRFEVTALRADSVHLERLPASDAGPPTAEAPGFALPDLPVSVAIDLIEAERLSLGPSVLGEPVVARLRAGLTLEDGGGAAALTLARTDGQPADLALEAGYEPDGRVLRIDLRLEEAAGGLLGRRIGLPGAPSIDLSVNGVGPLEDFTARLRLATDGAERLGGEVSLRGAGAEGDLAFEAALGGDMTPLFLPEYRDFLGADLRLELAGLAPAEGGVILEALRLRARSLRLEGGLEIDPGGAPRRVTLSGEIAPPAGDSMVLLPVPGGLSLRRAQVTASFDAETGPEWQVALVAQDVLRDGFRAGRLALEGAGRFEAATDSAPSMFAGRFDYRAEDLGHSDAAMARALGPRAEGRARLSWQEGRPLIFEEMALAGRGYAVDLAGQLALGDDGPTFAGRAAAALEDMGLLAGLAGQPLSGGLSLRATGRLAPLAGLYDLALEAQGRDLALGEPRLDRLLAGMVTLSVDAARDVGGTVLRDLALNGPRLEATAEGRAAGTALALDYALSLVDLSDVLPDVAGPLAASGTLRAEGEILSGEVAAEAPGGTRAEGSWRIEEPAGRAAGRADLSVAIDDLSAWADVAGRALSGALEGHLVVSGSRGTGDVAADVELGGTDLALGQVEVDRLLRGESRARVSVSRASQEEPWRLGGLSAATQALRIEAQPRDAARPLALAVEAVLNDLGLIAPEVSGPLRLEGSVEPEAGRFSLDLAVQGPAGSAARVAGWVAEDGSRADLSINGSAPLALADPFIGGQVLVRGPLAFDLRLDGAPGLSALSGRLSVTGARAVIAEAPLSLEGLSVGVDLSGGTARMEATAQGSHGGGLAVSGQVGLTNAGFPGQLSIALDSLGLRDPALYDTVLNAQLAVDGPLAGGALVSGLLRVGRTELRIPAAGIAGGGTIPPIVHLGDIAAVRVSRERAGLGPARAKPPGRPYRLDLRIEAPAQIFLRGRGLDAELGGAFTIGGTTADVVPTGRLDLLRGRLDILGRRLMLSEGWARLTGSLDPEIFLSARADAGEGTTVFVEVSGTPGAPEIAFRAVPELPEDEVLARLFFGRGLGALSPFQAAQLAAAVAELAGQGGEGIVGRLRRGLGLDDLDVTTGTDGGTDVRLGKYLSDNIYTDVTIGSEGRSNITINLDVTPNVTARGRFDSDGSGGVGVFIERDY